MVGISQYPPATATGESFDWVQVHHTDPDFDFIDTLPIAQLQFGGALWWHVNPTPESLSRATGPIVTTNHGGICLVVDVKKGTPPPSNEAGSSETRGRIVVKLMIRREITSREMAHPHMYALWLICAHGNRNMPFPMALVHSRSEMNRNSLPNIGNLRLHEQHSHLFYSNAFIRGNALGQAYLNLLSYVLDIGDFFRIFTDVEKINEYIENEYHHQNYNMSLSRAFGGLHRQRSRELFEEFRDAIVDWARGSGFLGEQGAETVLKQSMEPLPQNAYWYDDFVNRSDEAMYDEMIRNTSLDALLNPTLSDIESTGSSSS